MSLVAYLIFEFYEYRARKSTFSELNFRRLVEEAILETSFFFKKEFHLNMQGQEILINGFLGLSVSIKIHIEQTIES